MRKRWRRAPRAARRRPACRGYQDDVDDGANEAAAQRQQLGERQRRIAEVEAIGADDAKENRQAERNVESVAGSAVPARARARSMLVSRARARFAFGYL